MTERDDERGPAASRRSVLLSAGALGAAGILAACGGDEPTGTNPPPGGSTAAGPPPPPPPPRTINTADIPVGGGLILEDRNLVVTQPTAGTFKAFNATCSHQGCQVAGVSDGKISCPCHGSQYSVVDGSVTRGPALRGLSAKKVTVDGDTLTVS